jgi:hypothetical protein
MNRKSQKDGLIVVCQITAMLYGKESQDKSKMFFVA